MKNYKLKIGTLALLHFAFCIFNCQAELTATVSPGYTFATGERPSTSSLNRLGLPTISITGTLDGTNAGISAGSLNANMFSASVVDDQTIDFTNSSPQALRIKAAGVNAREVSTNLAGAGLVGGAGTVFSVNADGVTLVITNDILTLATNPPSFLVVASNSVVVGSTNGQGRALTPLEFATNVSPGFTFTGSIALSSISAAGKYFDTAHGLGVTPKTMHVALVCGTADQNYSVGDELDFGNIWSSGGTSPIGTPWCNSTNVGVTTLGAANTFQIPNKTTGAPATPTAASWTLKIYARP